MIPFRLYKIVVWAACCAGFSPDCWAIRYGEVIGPEEFRSVGLITVLGQGIGTGTLIDTDTVLTVAHVVDGATSPQYIRFTCDGSDEIATAVAVRIGPNYLRVGDTSADDIAIVKLNRPMSGAHDRYSVGYETKLAAGDQVVTVGYGDDATGQLNIRTKGSLEFYQPKSNGCLLFVPGDANNQMADHGDSGGALLRRKGRSFEIVGLVQGGYPFDQDEWKESQFDAVDVGQFVSIRRHAAWIRRTVQELSAFPVPTQPPRYIPCNDTKQSIPPRSIRQLCGLLRVRTEEAEVWKQAATYGVSEPISQRALQMLRAAGGSAELTNGLAKLSEPVLGAAELRQMVSSGASEADILAAARARGGVYLQPEEDVSGVPARLLATLQRMGVK